jgi:hypothetical protein
MRASSVLPGGQYNRSGPGFYVDAARGGGLLIDLLPHSMLPILACLGSKTGSGVVAELLGLASKVALDGALVDARPRPGFPKGLDQELGLRLSRLGHGARAGAGRGLVEAVAEDSHRGLLLPARSNVGSIDAPGVAVRPLQAGAVSRRRSDHGLM